MSVSIYYTAKRQHHLSAEEKAAIEQIVTSRDVIDELEKYLQTGSGYNWETFCIYDVDSKSDVIFEGATKLPNNTEDAVLVGLEHWLSTLSLIRRVLSNSEWHVHIDDIDIPWNRATQSFDLSLV